MTVWKYYPFRYIRYFEKYEQFQKNLILIEIIQHLSMLLLKTLKVNLNLLSKKLNQLLKLVTKISDKYRRKLKEMTETLKPCHYCNSQRFMGFLLLEILHNAMVETIKRKEFSELIKLY